MRTGLTKQEKTTEIYFDEKDPTIFIRTHNTDLKNRLTAYSRKHPAVCKLTDVDPDTGCKEFEIEKGRFSFRLTAPYREERRRAASEAAKKNSVNRIQHCHPGEILRCIHGLSAGADGNKKSPKHRPARSASG